MTAEDQEVAVTEQVYNLKLSIERVNRNVKQATGSTRVPAECVILKS